MMNEDHGPHLPKPTPLDDPPAVSPPVAPPAPPPPEPVNLATDDVPCRNCGFNLRGLSEDGRCPECGAPIWNSIQEDLLIYSSESYLTSLYRGLACILIAALVNIGLAVIGIVIGVIQVVAIAGSGTGGTGGFTMNAQTGLFNAIMQLLSLPVALLSLYGWWLFSSPDPGQRVGDAGQTPRQVIRIVVIVLAATNVIVAASQFAVLAYPSIALAVAGLGLIAFAATVAQFFAAMLYIRWMGPRIPDEVVTSRAQLYMWLLPVILVAGSCVVVGPIVAWVMYLLLLNRIRIDIRDVRERVRLNQGRPPDPATAM